MEASNFFLTNVPGLSCIALWLLWCGLFLGVSDGLWFGHVKHSRVYHQLHWVLGVHFLRRRSPALGCVPSVLAISQMFAHLHHLSHPLLRFSFLLLFRYQCICLCKCAMAGLINHGYNLWGMMIFKNRNKIHMANDYRICHVKINEVMENTAVKLYVPL